MPLEMSPRSGAVSGGSWDTPIFVTVNHSYAQIQRCMRAVNFNFFSVIWVPPEVKDKVLEPLTSVQEGLGRRPDDQEVKDALQGGLAKGFGIEFKEGELTKDEKLGYEKYKAVATLPKETGSGNRL
jgi:CO dehydrogenase/acetyl-CoA synthase beta subunit